MTEINKTKEILEKTVSVPIEFTKEQYLKMLEFGERLHLDYLDKSAGSTIHAKDCYVYQNSN
jgi:hypothetical protein